MQSSVITTLPSELVQFPFFEMLDNLSNEELFQVKKNLAMCPSDEQLLTTYVENGCWEDFRGLVKE